MIKRLTAWLSDHWLNIRVQWHAAAAADRMREDQGPFYRPVPLFPDRQPDPEQHSEYCLCSECARPYIPNRERIQPAAAHCVNCGHRGTVLVPDGTEPAELDGQILDMLECPRCGLYTMCSD